MRTPKTGALAGALVGFVTGDDSDDRLERAFEGAVIGGLIGYSLDEQAAALEKALGPDSGVLITNTGDRLIVTLPQDILFATNSSEITPAMRQDLQALARNLLDYPDSNVQVIGHTDSVGTAEYNLDLSGERAVTVRNVLQQGGVPAYRLQAVGQGETQPVATNQTDAGRARNRRVEIIIVPNQ